MVRLPRMFWVLMSSVTSADLQNATTKRHRWTTDRRSPAGELCFATPPRQMRTPLLRIVLRRHGNFPLALHLYLSG